MPAISTVLRIETERLSSARTLAMNTGNLMGFAMYSSAPQTNPMTSLSSSFLAVSMMIGSCVNSRMIWHARIPSITGIMISRMARLMSPSLRIRSTASWPLAASMI